jgi:hypothetical protein
MTRPTRDDLANATGHLEELAWRHDSYDSPTGFPDIATLLDLLVWVNGEIEHAKDAAVYGPGWEQSPEGGGQAPTHVPGRGGFGRPVESRLDWGTEDRPRLRPELRDPLYRTLRDLRSAWHTELGQLVDSWRERAKDAARWPVRTEDTG